MSEKVSFDPSTTAVLIMDYQNDILKNVKDLSALLQKAVPLLDKARAAQLMVIHVRVAFREGHPEVSGDNPIFGGLKKSKGLTMGTPGADFHEAVAPKSHEVQIIKKRVSAFAGSDLDVVLRGNKIQTLVLLGVSSSGVVLSTLRYAADMDFHCIVIEDCCADSDPEVHKVLMTKVFPRQAKVLSADEFIQSLAKA